MFVGKQATKSRSLEIDLLVCPPNSHLLLEGTLAKLNLLAQQTNKSDSG